MELKEALVGLGWSQGKLARRLGVSPKTVSAWATGRVGLPGYAREYLRVCLVLSRVEGILREEV